MKIPAAPFETTGLRASTGAATPCRQTELHRVADARCVGHEAHSLGQTTGRVRSSEKTRFGTLGAVASDGHALSLRDSLLPKEAGRSASLPSRVPTAAAAVFNDGRRRLSDLRPAPVINLNNFTHLEFLPTHGRQAVSVSNASDNGVGGFRIVEKMQGFGRE